MRRSRALQGWPVWSIGLSPDGNHLFAVGDSGSIADLDAASSRVIATFDLAVGQPIALMRVAAPA